MPYAKRRFACCVCGAETSRRAASGAEVRCVECAVARSAQAAMSLHTRSGEFYERWADGMERAAHLGRQMAYLAAEINSIG